MYKKTKTYEEDSKLERWEGWEIHVRHDNIITSSLPFHGLCGT